MNIASSVWQKCWIMYGDSGWRCSTAKISLLVGPVVASAGTAFFHGNGIAELEDESGASQAEQLSSLPKLEADGKRSDSTVVIQEATAFRDAVK
ncbi:uncharacterized protein UV8b_00062 [Ustilaginoidea virens]|uniref:Uncharacterized protein n=1 Tax=Ustilaginoidea virens TaxID=1159556 RepID=A0A8E5HI34_USTVR|nr:uncharacterized protein UV8b_00062 [Ustilaginoidea virens]QUC15821.1 hypothetical protein UV8b_00062 [Ustilaginoidea virens]